MQCVMCACCPPPLCRIRACSPLADGALLASRAEGPFPALPFPSVGRLSVLLYSVFTCGVLDVA